jgi:hypothetical protein
MRLGTVESIALRDGTVLNKGSLGWPAMQDIAPQHRYACDVCPLNHLCQDGNEFDCQVYGMFSGFWHDPIPDGTEDGQPLWAWMALETLKGGAQ